MPGKPPVAQGWVLGLDKYSTGPPESLIEGSLWHALRMVEEMISTHKELEETWSAIKVYAGNKRTTEQLLNWFNKGALGLKTVYAAEIVAALNRLAKSVKQPILIQDPPGDFFNKKGTTDSSPGGLVMVTAWRLIDIVAPFGEQSLGERTGRLPWTRAEVKAHLKRRYQQDEKSLMTLLDLEGSLACSIQHYLDLDRVTMRAVLSELSSDRQCQMAFAGIVCGTMFKCADKEGNLLPVKCPLCEEVCTLAHLKQHAGLGDPPNVENRDILVEYLCNLVRSVAPSCRALPSPM